jgi:hypothetical protein
MLYHPALPDLDQPESRYPDPSAGTLRCSRSLKMIQIRKCSKNPGFTSQTFSYPGDWACESASATAAIVAWAIYGYWVDTRNTHIVIDRIKLGEETGLHGNEMSEGFRILEEQEIIEELETKNDVNEYVIRFYVSKLEELFNNPESYLREIGKKNKN